MRGRRIRTVLALGGVMLLTACLGARSPDPGFRDLNEPLSVTTRGTSQQMQGVWMVRAAYPGDEALQAVSYLPDWQGAEAFGLVRRSCAPAGACRDVGEIWRAEPLGQHRWRIAGPRAGEVRALWVIWVDEGFRTAAIGAPDGTYGWILDRSAQGGADRIAAAREILEFNGYDTGALTLR